jgi:hypothetical protein
VKLDAEADEYNGKGVDLLNQGRYGEALAAFDISIDIEPSNITMILWVRSVQNHLNLSLYTPFIVS